MDTLDRFRGCLLGLAVGDALGTSLEFKPRGSFHPLKDMVGGGPFRLQPGEWTDDTSMALCLATSLVECNGFDARDQMERYLAWWQRGYLSSNGRCFDIGNTVREALQRYQRNGDPFSGSTDLHKAGNGCIMRLAPIPMFYFASREHSIQYAMESSRTTHGAIECLEACSLFADQLWRALRGKAKDEILLGSAAEGFTSPAIQAIAQGSYLSKTAGDIRGSGYVVHSLEAALWCFWATDSFEAAVLQAANLGEDADTTAAVCGQVAGAFYGESGIPARWLERLKMKAEITALAEGLYQATNSDRQ